MHLGELQEMDRLAACASQTPRLRPSQIRAAASVDFDRFAFLDE